MVLVNLNGLHEDTCNTFALIFDLLVTLEVKRVSMCLNTSRGYFGKLISKRTPAFCTYVRNFFRGFTFAQPTDDDVRTAEDAVVVDGRGHEDRSSRELLTRARGWLCRHGCERSESARDTAAQNDAGFDRQRGRSRQHHDDVNGLLLPLQKPIWTLLTAMESWNFQLSIAVKQ